MRPHRLAWLVLSVVACAHAAAPPPEPRPSTRARVEPSPAPPLPETAFQSECDACAPPPPSRFTTRSIGEGEPSATRWSGRRVNLDLKNADLQEVFRLIADVGKVNIVVAGEVSGTITVKLHDVPWDQALDVIARAKNLAVERDGNVYLVRPAGVSGKP